MKNPESSSGFDSGHITVRQTFVIRHDVLASIPAHRPGLVAANSNHVVALCMGPPPSSDWGQNARIPPAGILTAI